LLGHGTTPGQARGSLGPRPAGGGVPRAVRPRPRTPARLRGPLYPQPFAAVPAVAPRYRCRAGPPRPRAPATIPGRVTQAARTLHAPAPVHDQHLPGRVG